MKIEKDDQFSSEEATISPSEVIFLSDNGRPFIEGKVSDTEKSLTDELVKNKFNIRKKITTIPITKNVSPNDLNKIA